MPTSEYIRKRALLEDQIPLEQMTPDQIRRKDARDRKRAARAEEIRKAQEAAARKKEEADAQTLRQWWEVNRKKLTVEERERLVLVHGEMLGWVAVMDDYVNGIDGTTEQDLQDTIADIRALVAEHGLCDTGFLVVSKFWADKPLFEAVINRARNVPQFRADEVFARYGCYTALPSHIFEPFRAKFMTPKVTLFQPKHAAQICPECREIVKYTVGTGECNMLPSGKTAADGVEVRKTPCRRCDAGQDQRFREAKEQAKKKLVGEGNPSRECRRNHL